MELELRNRMVSYREFIFQIVLHLVVFVFFAYEKNRPFFEPYKLVYFLNYSLAALLINYILLPRYLYKLRYVAFALGTLLVILLVILTEELIWEHLFFPDTRAKHFPGSFYTLIQLVPLIVILSGFKFAWDALQKQKEVDELKATMQESELEFLKSQINPHFLFNNLNNLYSYAIENSPKTPSIILELSSVLRYMLYDCKEEYVPLSKELEHLENFSLLNQLQIEDRGNVEIRVDKANHDYVIAPLILIVFVENAFKHSQACQSCNISIRIEVETSPEGELSFSCSNTYDAMENTQNIPHGIGLENVKKRLELLYPGAYRLEINSDDHLYEVSLKLKLKHMQGS